MQPSDWGSGGGPAAPKEAGIGGVPQSLSPCQTVGLLVRFLYMFSLLARFLYMFRHVLVPQTTVFGLDKLQQ